jgi:hypothetical protein
MKRLKSPCKLSTCKKTNEKIRKKMKTLESPCTLSTCKKTDAKIEKNEKVWKPVHAEHLTPEYASLVMKKKIWEFFFPLFVSPYLHVLHDLHSQAHVSGLLRNLELFLEP